MRMRLDAITLDHELQPRREMDAALLEDYTNRISEGTILPPVVVFAVDGKHLLADGYHRFHGHKFLNLPDIEVEVHEGDRLDAAHSV